MVVWTSGGVMLCKKRKSDMNDKTKDLCKKALKLIEESQKITLLTHYKPDGDGISACVALEIVLSKMGKEVETIYPNTAEFKFSRQPRNLFINEHKQTPDLIIACDTANYDRLYFPEVFKPIKMINIDHHVSNTIRTSADVNFVISETSSTCEVLFDIIKEWESVLGDKLVNKEVAEALLFGILYDSRVFHTQSTYPSTLRIAADLIEYGADLFKLKCELLAHKDPEIIRLWVLMLDRISISEDKKVVSTYITQDDLKRLELTLSSLLSFNNFLSDISEVDVTLLFYETDEGKTKVSLRSKHYDVNKLAAKFGGGGHKNAAGILVDEPLQELMGKVLKAV